MKQQKLTTQGVAAKTGNDRDNDKFVKAQPIKHGRRTSVGLSRFGTVHSLI